MRTLNLFVKRTVLTTGIILSLMITSSAGSYTSGIQSESLPPGTYGYGSCKTDITFLQWCGGVCRALDFVHPHVFIERTTPDGQKIIHKVRGFHPTSEEAVEHVAKVLAYYFSRPIIYYIFFNQLEQLANKFNISTWELIYIIDTVLANRFNPDPVPAVVQDEEFKHPGDVYDCEIEADGLKYSDSRLQGVLYRMNNPHDFEYHLADFNSQHWTYWVLHNKHKGFPFGIGI